MSLAFDLHFPASKQIGRTEREKEQVLIETPFCWVKEGLQRVSKVGAEDSSRVRTSGVDVVKEESYCESGAN